MQKRRIMIIGYQQLVGALADGLRAAGYEVLAREIRYFDVLDVRDFRPDVVVMDGLSQHPAHAVREYFLYDTVLRAMPFVIVARTTAAARALGAHACVQPPARAEEVAAAIESLLSPRPSLGGEW
jgi:hypothetical protein